MMTNHYHTTIYTGVTSDLIKRTWQHKNHATEGFTSKYQLTKLVYYEIFEDINSAIVREKQLKGGSRKQKVDLINKLNPKWQDLYPTRLDDFSQVSHKYSQPGEIASS